MTEKLTLVSHHLCPYVQRAAIALAEKGVPFVRINIPSGSGASWTLEGRTWCSSSQTPSAATRG